MGSVAAIPRRALVIGSQCEALGAAFRLSFLPSLAVELYEALVDPLVGACEPALPHEPDGGLLLDPKRTDVLDALKEAFAQANNERGTLLIALLGHGVFEHEDFYYLSSDSVGSGDDEHDVLLSHKLKQLLAGSGDLGGLIVWLDACQAGTAARQAAQGWGSIGLGATARRYEILAATDDRSAYRGEFTHTLLGALRRGIRTAGDTIDANDLGPLLIEGAPDQQPQRVTVEGRGWAQRGDQGLWLAYNAALHTVGDAASGAAARTRAGQLVELLQPTATLDALVTAAGEHRCVMLTGPRGSGKSTLAAALADPASTDGHVPEGFVHAIAFADSTTTMDTLSAALSGQLRSTVEGFAQAVNEYDSRLDTAEREGLPAFERRVSGPLRLATRTKPVRIVIDAVDELPEATQQILRAAVTGSEATGAARTEFVLTARPGAARPAGATIVPVTAPGDHAIAAYLHRRHVDPDHVPLLVEKAAGNWLHAYLLAEQAIRPRFDPKDLPGELEPALTRLYECELLAAGAGDRDRWETQLRPVLSVVAAAGTGPALPMDLAVAASARLGGPTTASQVRDAVVRLSGLIVRGHPAQADERIGLFHLSLAEDYLLRPGTDTQFTIDGPGAHRAVADAIGELAPADQHDRENPLHQYALRAEAEHLWACGDTEAVIASLHLRPLDRPIDEVERWAHWAARFEEALGAQHPETLNTRVNLAQFTSHTGNPMVAHEQLIPLLPALDEILGTHHTLTLTARLNCVHYLGEAGHPAAARDGFAQLLSHRREFLGPEDPSTLAAWSGFAHFTGTAGDPHTAREEYNRLIPIRTRVSGPDDYDTLTDRANRACNTGESGNLAAARREYRELIPRLEQLLGPTHPEVLADRSNFARFTGEAGAPDAACRLYAELQPIRERVLGPLHRDNLVARANAARFIGQTGNHEEACRRYEALHPDMEAVLGPAHRDTLACRLNHAHLLLESGRRFAARKRYAALLPLLEQVFGSDDPVVEDVRSTLDGLPSPPSTGSTRRSKRGPRKRGSPRRRK